MKINRSRTVSIVAMILVLAVTYGSLKADTSTCGGASITVPFTDVGTSFAFCFIAEAYFSGLTSGTSATTFSPSNTVTREQMAVFITHAQDAALRRGSRRAALNQFWTTTPHFDLDLATTSAGILPQLVASDGADLWVANPFSATVSRVRASDGKLLETWTGASGPFGVLSAMGRIFVTGATSPGSLYMIDPGQPAGAVTTVSSNLGSSPEGIAFDGNRIWTANQGGSISIVTPGAALPWAVTTVSTGFTSPIGILYDGTNIWVSDFTAGTLLKLDSSGNILQTVTVGANPQFAIFDGTNIWVPNFVSNTISVVRASPGTVLATLSGNGLHGPVSAAFDGQRILVTNLSGNSVSLWKATDLTPLGTFSTGVSSSPSGACSDGLNFWITLRGTNKLARF